MATRGNYFARIDNSNAYFSGPARAIPPDREYHRAFEAFVKHLKHPGTVLGIGSGDGRHLDGFASLGFPVLGVDPCADRRAIAESRGVFTIDGTFENLVTRALPQVTGIWCGAALRHVPEDYLTRALHNVAKLLPSEGALFFTVELGETSEWIARVPPRGTAESLCQQFREDDLLRVLRQQGFAIVEKWYPEPTEGRSGNWIALVATKK